MGRHGDSSTSDAHGVSTGVVMGIAAGCLVFLAALTAMAYKCYRRRLMRNAQNRLSSAIKKGLQESGSGSFKRSVPVRGTGTGPKVMKSKGTSPITPPGGGVGVAGGGGGGGGLGESSSLERMPMTSFHSMSSSGGSDTMYVAGADVGVAESGEKDGATPEKEEAAAGARGGGGGGGEMEVGGGGGGLDVASSSSFSRPPPSPTATTTTLGSLTFIVQHDEAKSALMVSILRADDLPPPRDPSVGGLDPYVKLQLLPEKKQKCKTRVVRKTLQPRYDEIFTFYGISAAHMAGITLHFVVLSFDRFSRDEIIGEVIYPLSDADMENKDLAITRDITPRHLKYRSQGRGELLVSLCYQPAANRLGVVVLKARNLPKMDITGLSDPYVKIYLLYNGQRIAKKKTHVKKRTLNPVFNESFLFDVPYNEGLHNISLEFLVLDWDRMTKNEVVGRLEVGVKCGGQESNHWHEVMNCPRKQIAEWHKLLE
ncbi:synaptotagmin-4-like [Babylonia areolata]|uniref:synaptotagmin-4-like n=1 Tax=Babylonia areolata TaxID=304850 RepID=UPI003FD51861